MSARRMIAALLASVIATVGVVPGWVNGSQSSAATVPARLMVVPDDGGLTRSGRDLGVTVSITNSGAAALPAGHLTLSIASGPSASTSALLAAIRTPPDQLQGQLTRARASVPAIATAESRTVRLIEKHEDLDSILKPGGDGARVVYVQYAAGRGVRIIQQSAIVRMAPGSKSTIGLGTIIPLVAPPNRSGFVDSATQRAEVSPHGAWGASLRAAQADPAAAIALDPEVIASIRLDEDAASPEVTRFLSALRDLPNEFLRLPYADTDATLARAAGVTSALEPTSFANVATPSAAPTGATPSPRPTPALSGKAVAELTDWNWSKQSITWPVRGTTSTGARASFGTSFVLLSSADIRDSAVRRTSGPLAHIKSTNVIVSDSSVSSFLSEAAGAGTSAHAALATLTGLLATAAVTGETSALVAATDRDSATPQLDSVLQLLRTQRWIRPRSISYLLNRTNNVGVALKPGAVSRKQVTTARALVAGEHKVEELGKAVVAGGSTITAPQRLALLGTLSTAWRRDPDTWPAAAAATTAAFKQLLGAVQIEHQSSVRLVGSDGRLKVFVANSLDVPVRVTIHGAVSNGSVRFTTRKVGVIVPARARAAGILPFKSIRNGQTDLTLSLTTPDGTPLGNTVKRPATVSADLDTIVAIAMLALLAALLALGVFRNIKRRTRLHPSSDPSS